MEFIQSSFQASFDARIERVNTTELVELRAIFRYFDTDNDGAVSSDLACRMFALLGLDVNPAHVEDLEEVYLNEFIKIVDSHVPTPPPPPPAAAATLALGSVLGDASSVNNGFNPTAPDSTSVPMIPVLQIADPMPAANAGLNPLAPTEAGNDSSTNPESGDSAATAELDEDALRKRNEQLWEHEWKLVDTYRRGCVRYNELQLFLRSCGSDIPARDLLRFVEMYGAPLGALSIEASDSAGKSENEEEFVLTKAGFLKFRREYTEKDVPQDDSDPGLSSDDDEDDGGDADTEALVVVSTARGEVGSPDGIDADLKPRRSGSAAGVNTSRDSGCSHDSSERGGIVVSPGVLNQSDASDLDDDDDDNEEEEEEDEDNENEAQHSGDYHHQLADEAHADAFAED